MLINEITENKEILKNYIQKIFNERICKNKHVNFIKNNNIDTILCNKIIKLYNISLSELKQILDNDLIEITRFV